MEQDCSCLIPRYEDDGGTCNFYSTRIQKARKQHKCGECKDPILIGETYERVSGRWGSSFETHRTCMGCLDIRDNLFCNGWFFGEIWIDLSEADVITVEKAPTACILDELNEKGAEKMKQMWMRAIENEISC